MLTFEEIIGKKEVEYLKANGMDEVDRNRLERIINLSLITEEDFIKHKIDLFNILKTFYLFDTYEKPKHGNQD